LASFLVDSEQAREISVHNRGYSATREQAMADFKKQWSICREPFGAIKFHDSSRARLKRLEIVYERVVALFEPLNDVVISAHGGSSRVWLRKT
jgi:hypothetical protein